MCRFWERLTSICMGIDPLYLLSPRGNLDSEPLIVYVVKISTKARSESKADLNAGMGPFFQDHLALAILFMLRTWARPPLLLPLSVFVSVDCLC